MNHNYKDEVVHTSFYLNNYCICIIPGTVMYRSGRTPLPARLLKVAE